jgi:hypothetical protein
MIVKAYQQENNLIYVKLPPAIYTIDGKIIEVTSYSGEEFVLDKNAKIEQVISDYYISGYVNADTKESMTVEDYYKKRTELLSKQIGDDEEAEWMSITDRHNFELFNELWKGIREVRQLIVPVVIDLIGEPPIKHKFILPIRKIGGDLTNTIYRYNVIDHVIKLIKETFDAPGFAQLKTENEKLPDGAKGGYWIRDDKHIDFSKLVIFEKDKYYPITRYFTTEIPELKSYDRVAERSGTFEELEAVFKANNTRIRSVLKLYISKSQAVKEVDLPIGAILEKLRAAQNATRQIDSKVATRTEHNLAMKLISEAIDLVSIAVNKTDESKD